MVMNNDHFHTHDNFKIAGEIIDQVSVLKQRNAELEAKNEKLETENESLLQQNRELCQAMQVMYSKDAYDKQKYKQCLNNAWWCRKSSNAYAWNASNHRGWKIAEYYDKKAELYRKWRKRWLELADKFKEGK